MYNNICSLRRIDIAGLCNGSTADSDSVCEGSNPSPAAKEESLELQGFEGSFSLLFGAIYPLVCPLQHQNAFHTGKNTGGTRDKMSLVPPCFYIPRWGRLWILDYRVSTAPFKARCIAVVHDNALSFDLCITNQIRNICVVNREKPNITGCVVYESSVCSIHM